MDNKIKCYCGKTSKAIEWKEPRRESDFIDYLYDPESGIVILADSKGTTIGAYRNGSKDEEYSRGGEVFVDRRLFLEAVDTCVELSGIKEAAIELFMNCLKGREKSNSEKP